MEELLVIKRNRSIESFQVEKLKVSIIKAMRKNNKKEDIIIVNIIIDSVIDNIKSTGFSIETNKIENIVIKELALMNKADTSRVYILNSSYKKKKENIKKINNYNSINECNT